MQNILSYQGISPLWRGSATWLLHTKQANGCSLVSRQPRTCMIGFVYSSLGCLICEYRRDCTAPNKAACHQSKNYDLQSVYITCKNMYRTFSVAVSVAVMLLKKGSVTHLFHTSQ